MPIKDLGVTPLGSLAALPISQRNQLPSISAVYFAFDSDQKIQYIGQTTNLKGRITTHHKLADFRNMNLAIAWMEVSDVESLRAIEKQLIDHHKPPLNYQPQPKDSSLGSIKITLGHRREIIDRIAEQDGRSVSQTICLLLDVFLSRYDEIVESGKTEKRRFIDMAQRIGENASTAFLLKQFLKEDFSEGGFLELLKQTNVKPSAEFLESFSAENLENE